MVFAPNRNPHSDLPSIILIAIPRYRGPTEWHTDDGIPIPIVPSVARWEKNGKPCCWSKSIIEKENYHSYKNSHHELYPRTIDVPLQHMFAKTIPLTISK